MDLPLSGFQLRKSSWLFFSCKLIQSKSVLQTTFFLLPILKFSYNEKDFNAFSFNAFLIVIVLFFAGIQGCQKTEIVLDSTTKENYENIDIENAKSWFSSLPKAAANARVATNFSKTPDWDQAIEMNFEGAKAVVVPFLFSNADVPRIGNSQRKNKLTKDDDPIGVDALSNLLIYRKNNKNVAEIVTMLPNEDFYKKRQRGEARKKFTGYVAVSNLDGSFKKGYSYVNGKSQGNIRLGDAPQDPNGKVASYEICATVDWYTTACWSGGCDTHYDRTENIYCWVEDGSGSPNQSNIYLMTSGGGTVGDNGQGGYVAPSVLSFPGIFNTNINQTDIECLTQNNTSSYNYSLTLYVDQPVAGRSTPYSMNGDGVGHAFIGFSKTNPSTGQTITRILGYYPINNTKGNLALYIPVEGATKYNDGDPYDISYTVPLTASQFTTAVNTALDWDNHDYTVGGFNCSNAAISVFEAVGIGLPLGKSKILVPSAYDPHVPNPEVIFIYSPGTLGEALREMKANNPSFNVNTGVNILAPNNVGNCN